MKGSRIVICSTILIFTIILTGFAATDCTLSINPHPGKSYIVRVEVADTPQERLTGLMYRYHLAENKGMLFIFPDERRRNFWMKNTYIPLSIAYLNKKGFIMEIYKMNPGDGNKYYTSKNPAKYALEVNQGWFEKRKITVGHRIRFNGCFSK